jgi:Cu+-exporting ATPase
MKPVPAPHDHHSPQTTFNFADATPEVKPAAPPSSERQSFAIKGMHCASCAKRIEDKLSGLYGVKEAAVNYALKKASVIIDPAKTESAAVIKAIQDTGYDATRENPAAIAPKQGVPLPERRMVIALLLALPFLANMLLNGHAQLFSFPLYAQLILASIGQFYVALPFYRQAIGNFKSGSFTMDSLIAISTTASYGLSVISLRPDNLFMQMPMQHFYFETAVIILAFILLGRYLEELALARARASIFNLNDMLGGEAEVEQNGAIVRVGVQHLKVGDIIVIKPGARIPADGVIIGGESDIDEAFLSGESRTVFKKIGDYVYGGSINTTGSLRVRVEKTAASTRAGQIAARVEAALGSKTKLANRIDAVCAVFVPVILGIAAATFTLWFAYDLMHTGGIERALVNAVSVLVIACPCALGLATPTVILAIIALAGKQQILIRHAGAFDRLNEIDLLVFDKTGTLTFGAPQVKSLVAGALDTEALLRWAAAAAGKSHHPISKAISLEAKNASLKLPEMGEVQEFAGLGLLAHPSARTVEIGGKIVALYLGNRRFLHQNGFDLTSLSLQMEELSLEGCSLLFLGIEYAPPKHPAKQIAGLIALRDDVRPTALDLILTAKERQLKTMILTGDTRQAAERVARELGIDEVQAEIVPEEKAGRIKSLIQRGKHPLMLGDGINDAAALAQSTVGVAMGAGADLALEAADFALLKNDPLQLLDLFDLADLLQVKVKENLVWAFGFNIIGVPLAAFGFLNPTFAGMAMAASSFLIVTNALQLSQRRFIKRKS